jgi:hypothetical protein
MLLIIDGHDVFLKTTDNRLRRRPVKMSSKIDGPTSQGERTPTRLSSIEPFTSAEVVEEEPKPSNFKSLQTAIKTINTNNLDEWKVYHPSHGTKFVRQPYDSTTFSLWARETEVKWQDLHRTLRKALKQYKDIFKSFTIIELIWAIPSPNNETWAAKKEERKYELYAKDAEEPILSLRVRVAPEERLKEDFDDQNHMLNSNNGMDRQWFLNAWIHEQARLTG